MDANEFDEMGYIIIFGMDKNVLLLRKKSSLPKLELLFYFASDNELCTQVIITRL